MADTEDAALPPGWTCAKLGDLITAIEAGLNVAAVARAPETGETGIVKISAVTWGEFDEQQSKTLPHTMIIDPRLLISEGDFLISRANTLELVGAPVIVKKITRRLVLSDKVLRLRFKHSLDRWVELYLKSGGGRAQIEGWAQGAQLSMRNISQLNLRRIMVPIAPDPERGRIIELLDRSLADVDEAEAAIKRAMCSMTGELKSLRQSILHAAFTGRLVLQNPADEPASSLLSRLCAETAPSTPRRRGARAGSAPMNDLTADPAASTLVSKVWNLAHVLNGAGVGSGEYTEQVTYLLFLKLDDERVEEDGLASLLPEACRWKRLAPLGGVELARAYAAILDQLGREPGLIGAIYARARPTVEEPAHLKRLVGLIGAETWSAFGADVKGAIYEGLLERTASDIKSGTGQYFTPRPLIQAIVEVVDPTPHQTVCDPACGTGGFLLAAYDYMRRHPAAADRDTAARMRAHGFGGNDIVAGVARLATMNLFLHGLGGAERSPITRGDALLGDPGERWNLVLTNPPFGRKQSVQVFTGDGEAETEREDYQRPDFTETTGNKQLNFLQHVMTILAENGTAAVVLPDNVLFEGGAGERLRRRLLQDFDFHTMLRLPTGIFYRPGVKANVLFFDRRPRRDEAWTEALWVYDLRTNKRFTLKERPLRRADLAEFVTLARLHDRHGRDQGAQPDRWRRFPLADLVARDRADLNLQWLQDDKASDPAALPPPAEIAAEIADELEAAVARLRSIAVRLR